MRFTFCQWTPKKSKDFSFPQKGIVRIILNKIVFFRAVFIQEMHNAQ